MMIKCKKCKKEFDESFGLCPYCGCSHQPKKKKNHQGLLLRILAVASILLLVAATVFNVMGGFSLFEKENGEGATPGEAKTMSELIGSGAPFVLDGARPVESGAYGEILACELNEDNVYILTISCGRSNIVAEDWLYQDYNSVKEAILWQTGWEQGKINVRYLYSELLKEGLIVGQYKADAKTPLNAGDTGLDGVCFDVITRDNTKAELNEEEFLDALTDRMLFSEGRDIDRAFESLMKEDEPEWEFEPNGRTAEASIYDAYLANRELEQSAYPYIGAVIYEEGADGMPVEQNQSDVESDAWEITVVRQTPQTILMPNIIGMAEEQAKAAMQQRGIDEEQIVIIQDMRIPAQPGCVTASAPISGDAVPSEGRIYLFVYNHGTGVNDAKE